MVVNKFSFFFADSMFKSSNFFKGLTCPFYEVGFCERPYCHFRHVKPSTGELK